MGNRQVLLLGNGLNRAFDGLSWESLITDMSVRHDFDVEELKLSLPMQAVLMTNDTVDEALKNQLKDKNDTFWGKINTKAQGDILRSVLSLQFDDVLTTNYSYEIENAALNIDKVSENKLERQLSKATIKKVEPKYLLHSYNSVDFGGRKQRIWHIHGESRKEKSIVLGYYWYANILARWKKEVDGPLRKRHSQKASQHRGGESWLDSFLYGDVYILGFRFDMSEMDLWWLLNYKKRKNIRTGQIYFYEMKSECEEVREKIALLELMGVKIENCKMDEPLKKEHKSKKEIQRGFNKVIRDVETNIKDDGNRKEVETLKLKGEEVINLYIEESKENSKKDDSESDAIYKEFYNKAIADIKSKMEEARKK